MTSKPCPFCQIARGELEADALMDGGEVLAVLDHRPLFEGHALVFPTAHVETMLELPDDQVGPLFVTATRIARAMQSALGAHGALILVNNRVSQSVPHLHIHVVPRRFKDGLFAKPFFWSRRKYPDPVESARVAALLRDALAQH